MRSREVCEQAERRAISKVNRRKQSAALQLSSTLNVNIKAPGLDVVDGRILHSEAKFRVA